MCPAIQATGEACEYVYKIILASQKNASNVEIIVYRGSRFLGILAFFVFRGRLSILAFIGQNNKARNLASFLGHFEVETRPLITSLSLSCLIWVRVMMFLSAHNFHGKLTSGHMWPVLYPLKNNMEIICLSMWDNKKMHRFWIPFCVRRIVRCCYNLKHHSTTYQTQKKLRTFNGQSMGV